MKNENKIPLVLVASRLEHAIHADVGLPGLNILLHGADRKDLISLTLLRIRKQKDGYRWLTLRELQCFSAYAGYDLTKNI